MNVLVIADRLNSEKLYKRQVKSSLSMEQGGLDARTGEYDQNSIVSRKYLPKNMPNCNLKKSKKISNDQELIQSDPTSCPQNQKGNN